jgi:hypothetical protein
MRAVTNSLMLAGFLFFTSLACAADSSIAGTWQGKLHNLPAITLTLHETGGKVSGNIVFYFIRNNGAGFYEDSKSAGAPTELMNTSFDGKTLTFEVSHRNAHPPRTLNDTEPVRFQMEITGKDEGQLKRLNYGADENALVMHRGK